jgi:hypothetical protein
MVHQELRDAKEKIAEMKNDQAATSARVDTVVEELVLHEKRMLDLGAELYQREDVALQMRGWLSISSVLSFWSR